MNKRRLFIALAVGLLGVIGIPMVGAPTALAHDTSAGIYLCGSTYDERCGYGGVTNSHTRVYSCDTNPDNYGFRTEYRLRSGASGYVDDANGSSSGCSGIYPGSSSNPIVSFRVVWKRSAGWAYSAWYTA